MIEIPVQTLSHYRLLEKLGEGGMGIVYRARDEVHDRDVALKVLPTDLSASPERRLRFRREARVASTLSHPNIASVYGIDEQKETMFIAMELVEGRTLRSIMAGGDLSIREAIRIAVAIAEGLAHAHRGRVIHRDLKPENVIVGAGGRVKILDFGLAKLDRDDIERDAPVEHAGETIQRTVTRAGRVMGTPAYMSPEQARGQTVAGWSDQFSFGATLYEMVTGATPFTGSTDADVVSAIIRDRPVAPSRRNPDVPLELERIIQKCLEKETHGRYRDTDELVHDLRAIENRTDPALKCRGRNAGPLPESAEESAAELRPPVASGPSPTGPTARRRGRQVLPLAAVAALLLIAAMSLWIFVPAPPEESKVMLAVLPFDNLSADPEEWFSDGLTEEMIAHLGQLHPDRLGVIARTSVMRFKGTDKGIGEIGRALGVDHILEGSVRRAASRVRITAQLIQVSDETQVWAESYDRDLDDVFAIQSDVARLIAASLPGKLEPLRQDLPGGGAVSPAAHEAYLRAIHHLNTRDPARIDQAIRYLEEAVSLEPTYALAHAALADAYRAQFQHGSLPSREAERDARSKQEAATRMALDLAPNLAEAHLMLADVRYGGFDWLAADEGYRRAIQLNPNSALAHHYYSSFLATMRRFDEAVAESRQAAELDPLSPSVKFNQAGLLSIVGRHDEAIGKYLEALELSPGFGQARRQLALLYLRIGRDDEAIAEFSKEMADRAEALAGLERAIRTEGVRGLYRWWLQMLERRAAGRFVSPYWLAQAAAGAGQHDLAISRLEDAYRERDWRLITLNYDWLFDELHSDPRFRDLVQRLGLPRD